jgi:NADH-quinone oxidoreductase subunit L
MSIRDLVWLVPALPLAAALINTFLGFFLNARARDEQTRERVPGWLAVGLVGLAFAVTCLIVYDVMTSHHEEGSAITGYRYVLYPWINSGDFKVDVGFYIDPLSAAMMMLVTGVGWLIHIYSVGYMHGDVDPINERSGVARFFTYLPLFVFAMLMLVMCDNYLLMFLGWEGVGVCSYLLIGFWYYKKSASDAAKKAFIVNRVGDVGFALGIMLLFVNFGSLTFTDIFPAAATQAFVVGNMTLACLLLFGGAIGKSAQFPLHVWLPDAMEGPTPVSALIHAATMVTAGVYLVARSNPLFALAPDALFVVMIIGLTTALLGATIAIVNNDIKRVVAYSTVSQLGYMFTGLGVGAYTAAIFHLLMHGVFKALLFLGSGSVIHGLHGEQDIRRMGRLFNKMPWTALTFIVGALSNAGFWFFSGYWSKDEIIAAGVLSEHPWVGALLIFGSFLTAFYMFRLVFKVFWGANNVDPHVHPHESGPVMLIPLVVLAVPSVILGGLVGVPPEHGLINGYLDPVFATAQHHETIGAVPTVGSFLASFGQTQEWLLLIISGFVATIGIFFAWLLYYRESDIPAAAARATKPIYDALLNRWYFDDLYDLVFRRGGRLLTELSWAFDRNVVDGLVNGVAGFFNRSGARLRRTQTGFVGNYAFAIALGLIGLMTYLVYVAFLQ